MKRLLAFVVLLIVATGFVSAESVDVTSLTTDDLVLLRQKITNEIEARTADETDILPKGIYVVGKDIAAGKYMLKMPPDSYAEVYLLDSEKTLNEVKQGSQADVSKSQGLVFKAFLGSSEQAYLALYDGQVLLMGGEGRLTSHKPSWAPSDD